MNDQWTPTQHQLHGVTLGYKESWSQTGRVWFVATLDAAGERHEFVGQVELCAGVYFAYEYPTPEAAAEGAQDSEVGDALTLDEALELYASAYGE